MMEAVTSFFALSLGTVAALLPIINPFSTAPLFLALTEGFTKEEREEQARMGTIYMFSILAVFLIFGSLIMTFFGISLPGVRIAGGILVGRVAFGMLYPKDKQQTAEEEREVRMKKDISFFPLAMPSLSGPGSIAVVISMATLAGSWYEYFAILVGLVIITLIVRVTLRMSGHITRVLGVNGMHALTKIMGFLIFCIAIQFIVNGLTDPNLLEAVREGLGL